MDKFTTYEHDTLKDFITYLEPKVINAYRREIGENRAAPDELVRAVEQYPSNIIPIRLNRPEMLSSDQWDDLLFLFSRIENETAQNNMTRQIRSKNAGKCYQILLNKALSRQLNAHQASASGQSAETQPDSAGKACGRTLLLRTSQAISLLLLLALIVMLLLAPQSGLTIVLIAVFAVSLITSSTLMLLGRHRSRKKS